MEKTTAQTTTKIEVSHTNGHQKDTPVSSTNPKISVIIPVYQEEKILDSTLSLYTNDLKKKYNFELIVSDGGSTDGTVEIANRYADKVIVHSKPERQTISEGRNKGAENAVGDTLVFINADTIPANINTFFNNITQWCEDDSVYRGADAIACYVDPMPEEIGLKDELFYSFYNNYVWFLNEMGLGMGRGECQIIKKTIFNEVGGYNDDFAAGEDFDLYRRIGKRGRIYFARNIKVLESTRRFKKYGYFRTVLTWTMNSIAVMILGKSFSKEWEAVR